MSLRPITLDPLTDDRWSAFVAGAGRASVFHHPAWLALLHAQYRYRMTAECVEDASGRVVAGIPVAHVTSRLTGRRMVAVPFSDLCPILVGDGAPADAVEILSEALADEHRRTGQDIEVRGPVPGWPATGEGFYHHEIPLDGDLEAVRSRIRGNTRRDANRAVREGIEVRRGTSVADLATFYRLHLHTRRRLGVPTQPWRFIRRFAGLFDAGLGFVALASLEGEPVAGAVYLHSGTTLTYKYGASRADQLRRRPNHALFMEAMRWGVEHGMERFDLGRTDLDNEGLRAFKLSWGGEERQLAYAGLTRRPDAGRGGMPALASTVISHTHPVTGRLVGAALYRHFA